MNFITSLPPKSSRVKSAPKVVTCAEVKVRLTRLYESDDMGEISRFFAWIDRVRPQMTLDALEYVERYCDF